jgi:hypothetical protein
VIAVHALDGADIGLSMTLFVTPLRLHRVPFLTAILMGLRLAHVLASAVRLLSTHRGTHSATMRRTSLGLPCMAAAALGLARLLAVAAAAAVLLRSGMSAAVAVTAAMAAAVRTGRGGRGNRQGGNSRGQNEPGHDTKLPSFQSINEDVGRRVPAPKFASSATNRSLAH